MSTDPLTIIKCHLLQWDVQIKYTKVVSNKEHGRPIQSMDGTFKPQLNIINAIEYLSRKRKVQGYQTQFSSSNRYLTQSTVYPVDLIVKALGDLTQSLKGRRNMKGIEQIKALTKIDELLNNIPTINKTPTRKVTFDGATKPPQEVQVAPRVNNMSKSAKEHTTINTAIIDKPLTINTPPPRVEKSTNETPILDVPHPRVVESPKADREKIMLDPK
jgi:hypothetical protein